jgi:DNA-binding GntR family transcriptional regulator
MPKTPRYIELAATLRRGIVSGRAPVGAQLPTEHELCAAHDVSRHTARAALKVLEDEGLIERRPGLGTQVISAGSPPTFAQRLGGLDDLLQYAHETRLELVGHKAVALSAVDADRLGAARGSRWLRLDGVRRAGLEPVAATTVYVAEVIGAKPTDFRRGGCAVTETIEKKYGVATALIRQRIVAESLSKEDAAHLRRPAGSPGLRTLRRYYDAAEALFVISDSRHPGEGFAYEMTYRRSKGR